MSDTLEKITKFIHKHHVLTLATSDAKELSACSLFYTFCEDCTSFIVASADDTEHIKNIKTNNKIAGNILLETKSIGKIQGVQFKGVMRAVEDKELAKLYFKEFAYAKIMRPKLWEIKISYLKMTHNKLGFGKKLIWIDSGTTS